MTKRKGKHLDLDGFDAATDGMMTRLREFRDAAHRARSDAEFAERAEADFRLLAERLTQTVGAVLERDAREGVLDRRALELALADANQALERLAPRSDAHYAERRAEMERQEEALRAALTAFDVEPPHDPAGIPMGAGESSTRPERIVIDQIGARDHDDDDPMPGFLRRDAA